MKEDILKGLNEEQLEGVRHRMGPLLIIAGVSADKISIPPPHIWLVPTVHIIRFANSPRLERLNR